MSITRKNFLKLSAFAASASAFGNIVDRGNNKGGYGTRADSSAENGELVRVDAFQGVLNALDRHPLVGLGDPHMHELFHAFLRSLVRMPALQSKVDDIVVECGNAFYQNLSDRFFLDLESVDDAELSNMWRTTIGGRVYWDCPVYEQFYRTVRSVNESLPCKKRIRVVLGDPAIDWSQIQSAADAGKLPTEDKRETFYADVVEREVLAKRRRALLFIGGGHLRRGVHTTPGGLIPPDNPDQPSAGTILAEKHPGSLYVVLPFSTVNSAIASLPEGVPGRVEQTLASWPTPSLTTLAGTWLGPQPMPDRALDPNSTIEDQADALFWMGPDDTLMCSRPDPALYQSGDYAAELRRRSEIISARTETTVDLVAEGLHLASLGPSCAVR
ncbi:hypothetical protein [Nonomuraea sp. CA-141351]|uniref:hypothetical protein n=1 Tax=Nonomuraea sp. CA-141351 TaxID=3239996 RepID=UPI003D903E68